MWVSVIPDMHMHCAWCYLVFEPYRGAWHAKLGFDVNYVEG